MTNREPEFGVFLWHPDSRYKLSEAVKLYVHESAAQRHADKLNEVRARDGEGGGYVVRTLAYVHNEPAISENPAGGADMPQAFTYDDAAAVYSEVANRSRRRVPRGGEVSMGANTTIRYDGEDIVIRLHKTDIICYHPDDSVTLNSGGYRTTTTKGRINAFLSPKLHIYAEQGAWWIDTSYQNPVEFRDGIRISL